MELTITSAEREYLEATLGGALRSLREEVHRAEEHRFKHDIKAEEVMARTLLAQLRAVGAGPLA